MKRGQIKSVIILTNIALVISSFGYRFDRLVGSIRLGGSSVGKGVMLAHSGMNEEVIVGFICVCELWVMLCPFFLCALFYKACMEWKLDLYGGHLELFEHWRAWPWRCQVIRVLIAMCFV